MPKLIKNGEIVDDTWTMTVCSHHCELELKMRVGGGSREKS